MEGKRWITWLTFIIKTHQMIKIIQISFFMRTETYANIQRFLSKKDSQMHTNKNSIKAVRSQLFPNLSSPGGCCGEPTGWLHFFYCMSEAPQHQYWVWLWPWKLSHFNVFCICSSLKLPGDKEWRDEQECVNTCLAIFFPLRINCVFMVWDRIKSKVLKVSYFLNF